MESQRKPEHLILWRRKDVPGHDACGLWVSSGGWRLQGTAVFMQGNEPCWLDYSVEGGTPWRTCCARVTGFVGTRPLALDITVIEGRWRLNGVEQPEAQGCTDVDLDFTPATNLIPLRRLHLAIGAEADAPAAWLDLSRARLQRLEQHYRRVGADTYDYRAPAAGYAAVLRVSVEGFVVHYPGLWELEALH